jgi:hypothetical protein
LPDKKLQTLCDIATEVHARIQQNFKAINPVVGVSQHMRHNGVPADAMTIECLGSNKRIILVLHDQAPDIISYQFTYKDKDPDKAFIRIPFGEMTADRLYGLIKDYFSVV